MDGWIYWLQINLLKTLSFIILIFTFCFLLKIKLYVPQLLDWFLKPSSISFILLNSYLGNKNGGINDSFMHEVFVVFQNAQRRVSPVSHTLRPSPQEGSARTFNLAASSRLLSCLASGGWATWRRGQCWCRDGTWECPVTHNSAKLEATCRPVFLIWGSGGNLIPVCDWAFHSVCLCSGHVISHQSFLFIWIVGLGESVRQSSENKAEG